VGVASARAGNVIGGGDWAADRLIPDLVRSVQAGSEALIRNPDATRPWQHVLEPLHGYLLLAQALAGEPARYSEAWNFGPDPGGDQPVGRVIEKLAALWPGRLRWRIDAAEHPHEAHKLMLDSAKAHERLGWRPKLSLDESLRLTAEWYARFLEGGDLRALTEAQVRYHSGPHQDPT
jgi:CDP-glucose 4,6-dehydratase